MISFKSLFLQFGICRTADLPSFAQYQTFSLTTTMIVIQVCGSDS